MRSLPLIRRFSRATIIACLVAAMLTVAPPAAPLALGQTIAQRGAARVNESPAAEHLIDQANHQISLEQYGEAAAIFQKILDEYGQRLLVQDEGLYVEAAQWVTRRLRSDRPLLDAYRRSYESAAERALEQARDPWPDRKRLETIRRRFALCEAGLVAALDLAAMQLESAAPRDAELILERVTDHPDFESHQTRWRLLAAAAALLGEDDASLTRHRNALRDAGQADALDQLTRWEASIDRPEQPTVYTSLEQLPVSTLLEPLGKPFWIHDLNDPPVTGSNRGAVVIRGRLVGRPSTVQRGQKSQFQVLPVGMGDLLFINEKTSVSALDRVSGRRLWTYKLDDDTAPPVGENNRRTYTFNLADQRAVAIDGDRLIAVMGLPQSSRRMIFGERDGQYTTLTCLDRTSGQPLWQVTPEELDAELAGSAFHGTPQVGGGLAFVLLRREQAVNFHDIFAVAVRMVDGRLAWHRHLLTTSTPGRFGWPITSELTAHDATLYVTDGVSAAAAIARGDGVIQWIRLLNDEFQDQRFALSVRGDLPAAAPKVVAAGAVFRLLSPTTPAVVLNPENGELIRKLTNPVWEQAESIQPAGEDLLITGQGVHLVSGADPSRVIWSRDLGAGADEVEGHPAVTTDRVLVTTDDTLYQLDLRDGHTISHDPIDIPGNILVMDGQVLIAGAERIDSHMAWPWAKLQLEREMKRRPSDPQPGIALARTALIVGERAAILDGLDHALSASDRVAAAQPQNDRQAEVFEQILWFVRAPAAADTSDPRRLVKGELRGELIDRLGLATVGPAQQVVYQLEMGKHLTDEGRFQQAADFYQAILDSPELADQLYEHQQGHSLLAALEARMRLADLIERAGEKVYARYEAMAAERLEQLAAQPLPDPQALMRIAEQYPLARVAARARITAAQAFEQRDDPDAAVDQWRKSYLMLSGEEPVRHDLIQRVVSRLVGLYEQQKKPDRARSWLRTAMREFPDLELRRQDQPIAIDQWLSLLDDQSVAVDSLPTLTLPLGSPFAVPGKLLVPTVQRPAEQPRDNAITLAGRSVQYRGGERLSLIWEYEAPDEAVELLALTDDQVLLWFAAQGLILSLDAHTGRPMWGPIPLANLLDIDPDDAARRAQVRGLRGEVNIIVNDDRRVRMLVDAASRRPVIRLGDRMICACDRISGNVLALDRYSGEIIWGHQADLGSLLFVELANGVLALGGSPDARGGNQRPPRAMRIILLDIANGKAVRDPIEGDSILLWLGLPDNGTLLQLTREHLTATSINDGQVKWRHAFDANTVVDALHLEAGRLLLVTGRRSGAVVSVDIENGRVSAPVSLGPNATETAVDARAADGAWYLMAASAAICQDAQGNVRWRDAIFSSSKNFLAQLVGKQHVALLGTNTLEDDADTAYLLHILSRDSGAILAEYAFGPLYDRIDHQSTMLLDHRILLGTARATIVIPDATADR